jgi:hypothetical protein
MTSETVKLVAFRARETLVQHGRMTSVIPHMAVVVNGAMRTGFEMLWHLIPRKMMDFRITLDGASDAVRTGCSNPERK